GRSAAFAPLYWLSTYSATLGGTQPAARAAAAAIAPRLFCATPCSDRSQQRTAFWSIGSMSWAWTSATHSSSDRPVRTASDALTALSISSGVCPMPPSVEPVGPVSLPELGGSRGRPRRGHDAAGPCLRPAESAIL